MGVKRKQLSSVSYSNHKRRHVSTRSALITSSVGAAHPTIQRSSKRTNEFIYLHRGSRMMVIDPVAFEVLRRRCNVTGNSSSQLWFDRHLEFRCEDCGSNLGFRSRRRTFSERYLLPICLVQPVRCGECFRRDYRFVFMPVKERLPETVKKMSISATGSNRNVA